MKAKSMRMIAAALMVAACAVGIPGVSAAETSTNTASASETTSGSSVEAPAEAPQITLPLLDRFARGKKIMLDTAAVHNPDLAETVLVRGDTVSVILPQKNYGRYDRGLFNYLFIPKGMWQFGITASYGEYNTEDFQLLDILTNCDTKIKAYSVQPTIGYFFAHNQCVGMKFNYTRMNLDIADLGVDFEDDVNFSLHDVSYYSNSYSTSVFYRNYVGLGRERRFGVFNDVDLAFGSGTSRFRRSYNGELFDTRTNSVTASLNFSPGVCIYIMDYLSFNVSFGVFGVKLHHEKQTTNGVNEGSRFSSGANFRFNIFNINFGLAVSI